MSNKFLDLYPKLRDPKIGDMIKIINPILTSGFYNKNDITDITSILSEYGITYYFTSINLHYPLVREEFEIIYHNNEK